MFILTNTKTNSLPVGGAQHITGFIDKIMPAHRDRVRALKPNERTTVTFCPLDGDAGYPIEVYRTKEGSDNHNAHFQECLNAAQAGEVPSLDGLTKRQMERINTVVATRLASYAPA